MLGKTTEELIVYYKAGTFFYNIKVKNSIDLLLPEKGKESEKREISILLRVGEYKNDKNKTEKNYKLSSISFPLSLSTYFFLSRFVRSVVTFNN